MVKVQVFADTNVILEAFRTGCWTAISNHFAIETVEKCVEETLTGNPGDPRHIAVTPGRTECRACPSTPSQSQGACYLGVGSPRMRHTR